MRSESPEPYRVLAIICARAGSRGLQHKNVRALHGVPLLVRAVELAHASRRKREQWQVVVSTDSRRYARLARAAGAEVPGLRPLHLATDESRLIDAVVYTLDQVAPPEAAAPHAVVLLSATTPLTTVLDVRRALDLFRRGGGVSVASVCADPFPDSLRFGTEGGVLTRPGGGRGHRVGRRQEAPPRVVLNGAIYVASPRWLRKHHQFVVPGRTLPLPMPAQRSLDIESAHDLALAEWRLGPRAGRHG